MAVESRGPMFRTVLGVAEALGDKDRAATGFGAAAPLESLDDALYAYAANRLLNQRAVDATRILPDDPARSAAWSQGCAMGLGEAVTYASADVVLS